MDETPDQLRSEVEHVRYRLGKNLDALESRVKEETDWRVQFRRHTWAFMGAAFGAALLFGYALGSASEERS